MAFAVCLSVVHAPLAGPALAAAAADAVEGARGHHDAGRAHVREGRYESAIAEYRKAYELRADPSYLLDIAEAYRALGVAERALFFYRRYLTTHPAPPNRPEIEAQIAKLDPGGAATGPPALPPPTPAPPAPARASSSGREVHLAATRTVSDDERSVVGKWWFWAAVGALAAAGATVAILAAGPRDDDAPPTALGNVKIF